MVLTKMQPNDVDQSVSPFYAALRRTWQAFCASSSIHGLKYTQDRDTNMLVRFIWFLITLVMFACAIAMVITFYVKYRSNPTRMNIESDHAPVESLPFPAVTICPEALYNKTAARRYIETLNIPLGANISQLVNALSVTHGFINDDDKHSSRDIELLQSLIDLNDIDILTFMQELYWDCEDILFRCRYQWLIKNCKELFQRSRTFYGYCCSFNLKQDNLTSSASTPLPGLLNGLSLILEFTDGPTETKPNYSNGFKVLISENDAFPSGYSGIKFTPPKQENFFGLRPIETYCSQSVKELSIEERQCVLPDEFPLQHFPKYVAANCNTDSRANKMLKECGCLAYYFLSNRTNARVCSFKDIPCLANNFGKIIGRYKSVTDDCPNTCESVSLNVESTNSEIQVDIPTVDEFYNGIHENHTVVHIYLGSEVYRRIRRDLLSSRVVLISNLGSAFSLFVGISFVSIIEIFYYLTVVLRKYYIQEIEARQKLNALKLRNNLKSIKS